MPAAISLSLFWFFYFAGIGVYFPYFSLYLRENAGLTQTEVGIVLSTFPLVGMITQPVWGYIADRTGQRRMVLVVVTAGAGIGFLSLGQVEGFVALTIASAGLAAFAMSVVPLLFSISFGALRDAGPGAIGYTRVWGTIGFLILAVGFPRWLHGHQERLGLARIGGGPSEPGLETMFPLIAVLVAISAVVAYFLPRTGVVAQRAAGGQWRRLLTHGPLIRLMLFTSLFYIFTQGPMLFFPVWVRAHGGSIDTVGTMWIFMVALEIPLVLAWGTGLRRLGVRRLLVIGTLAAALRWIACGVLSDLTAIYAVQLLHGVMVAGLMLGSPLYLDLVVPEELRSSGQTLIAMVSHGVGAMLSTTLSGWLMEVGGVDAPYLIGGMGALGLAIGARWILPEPRRL